MVMERQFINADKFLEILEQPEYDDRTVELVEGVIVEMPFPSPIHAATLALLSSKIFVFVNDYGLGSVFAGDAPFVLAQEPEGRDTVRGLDIAFVAKDRMPEQLPRRPLSVAPDLAVEIISPSNTAGDIEKKIQQLLEAGTALIWIVYPDLRSISVQTRDGATSLKATDTLTGGEVLPGFEISVAEIFSS